MAVITITALVKGAIAMYKKGKMLNLALAKAKTTVAQKQMGQLITELVKQQIPFKTTTVEKVAGKKAVNVVRKFDFDKVKQLSNKQEEQQFKTIPLVRSKWLYSMKYTPINDMEGTIYITFKEFRTNGKAPVLVNATKGQYYQFLKAPSLGKFYLDNFSIYSLKKNAPTLFNPTAKKVFTIASSKGFKQPNKLTTKQIWSFAKTNYKRIGGK